MAMYMYVSEEDRINKRKVSNPYVNEEFQAALECDPSLMIEEKVFLKRTGFFKQRIVEEIHYHIYHETPGWDGKPYQARFQASASGNAVAAIAYLHGIVNGVMHYKKSSNKQ